MARVPVISKDGKPLMPTKPSRARRWIKEGKAIGKFNDLYHFSLFVADILLLSPKKGEGLGVRELTISAITLEKWY
jgi:hypothetical protein